MNDGEWFYVGLDATREAALLRPPPLEELARQIADDFVVRARHVKPFWDWTTPEERQSRQIVVRIRAAPQLCDQFYNGRDGIRARYWDSPTRGDKATRLVLDAVMPKLVDDLTRNVALIEVEAPAAAMSQEDIAASLRAPSAKMWPIEDSFADLGLEVPRWRANPHPVHKDLWSWTPQGDEIVIKGGLIDLARGEHIPRAKQDRARQIHCHGFS